MASRARNTTPTVDQMGAKRRRMLEYIYSEGRARTSEIRRNCDIPQGSKNYHFDKLRVNPSSDGVDSWAFVKVAARAPSEWGGSKERVWRLTSAGKEYVENTLSVDPTTREDGLTSRIEALERTVREQQAQINEFQQTQQAAKETADEARTIAEEARLASDRASRDVREGLDPLKDDLRSLRDDHDTMAETMIEKFTELRDDAQTKLDNLDGRTELQGDRIDELDGRITTVEEIAEDDEDEPQGIFEETELKLKQWFGPHW